MFCLKQGVLKGEGRLIGQLFNLIVLISTFSTQYEYIVFLWLSG